MTEIEQWLATLYALVEQGDPDAIGDHVFDGLDDLLLAGMFGDCDAAIEAVDAERLDSFACVAMLSATIAACHQLTGRPGLVCRVEHRLQSVAPGRVESLIGGLR